MVPQCTEIPCCLHSFVKYCSRDCQKAAWPTHKQSCLVAVDFHKTIKERGNEEFVVAFNKWLDCWRGTFFDMALSAMDLANHPPDRLATHTYAPAAMAVIFWVLTFIQDIDPPRAQRAPARGARSLVSGVCSASRRPHSMLMECA